MPKRDKQLEIDVLIIGAGAAGLAAARELVDAGVRTLVLEARDRIGGRIFTVRDHASPVPVELGAEFVHGRPESTWRLIRESGLLPFDVAENHWHVRRGRPRPIGEFWQRLERVMRGVQRLTRDVSFDQYLRRIRDPKLAEDKQLAAMFVEGFDAAYTERISAKSLATEQGQTGATQFRIQGGYDALLRAFSARREVAMTIGVGTIITHVRWRRGTVEAIDARSNRYAARAAIITLPVALLQQSHDESAGSIRFDPEIDATRRAARMLSSGPVVKVVLRFREPFWEEAMPDMSFVHWRGSAFPTWWTTLPLRTAVLTGWAGGPKADALAGRGDGFIVGAALDTLAHIARRSRRQIERMLDASHVYDWRSDPFARGAYSYVNVGGGNARAQLARPVERTLFFAGEATHTSGEAGTVAGAFASGTRAAREVIRAIG